MGLTNFILTVAGVGDPPEWRREASALRSKAKREAYSQLKPQS